MKKFLSLSAAAIIFSFGTAAHAAEGLSAMIGKWKWKEFTVVVKKCDNTGVCAKVVAGPKNVGLDMIKSKLEPRGKKFVGKVAHPLTGLTYNTQLSLTNQDTWQLDGCTDNKVCASGTFTRIK